MKTLTKILFSTLVLSHLCSCETEKDNCSDDNSNEEFIIWSLNGETFDIDFDHIDVYYADDRILNIYPLPRIGGDVPPSESFFIQYDAMEESAHYEVGAFTADTTFIGKFGSNLNMSVSSFSSPGDLICIQFDNGEFSGELKVILDKIVTSGTVQGKVWLDENENGINEPNESPLVNVDLYLRTDSENLQEGVHEVYPTYYPTYSIKTDENGRFTFNGVFVDYPIQIGYYTKDDIILTAANVGNDDTIDSDFYLTLERSYGKWYSSYPFIIEDGGSKKDIGLGLIKQ